MTLSLLSALSGLLMGFLLLPGWVAPIGFAVFGGLAGAFIAGSAS